MTEAVYSHRIQGWGLRSRPQSFYGPGFHLGETVDKFHFIKAVDKRSTDCFGNIGLGVDIDVSREQERPGRLVSLWGRTFLVKQ